MFVFDCDNVTRRGENVSIMRALLSRRRVKNRLKRKFFIDRVSGYAKIRPNGEAAFRCDIR